MAKKKRVSKKVTNKKSVKKKAAVKKKASVKKLKKASPEVSFYFCDGRVASDLLELSDAIDAISDEVFNYHVNDEKNDFANWVEHIHEEKELAEKLRSKKNKKDHAYEVLRVVIKRIR